jgi:hypothetical protein
MGDAVEWNSRYIAVYIFFKEQHEVNILFLEIEIHHDILI